MKKILIIDDDRDVAEVLSIYLEDLGFTTEIVHDGRSGIQMVKTGNYAYIFSDWRMPDLKGDEIFREIYKQDPSIAQRFILLTGALLDKDTEEFILSYGGRILKKPFRMQHLKDLLSIE